MSGHPASNQAPSDGCSDLQSDALPTELWPALASRANLLLDTVHAKRSKKVAAVSLETQAASDATECKAKHMAHSRTKKSENMQAVHVVRVEGYTIPLPETLRWCNNHDLDHSSPQIVATLSESLKPLKH